MRGYCIANGAHEVAMGVVIIINTRISSILTKNMQVTGDTAKQLSERFGKID
jgi:plasmid maintenance system antidote protein VapI